MALTNATTLADYSSGIGTQGATLKVDADNQRVGIGTLTPAETLDVVGNMAVEGDFSVTGTISYEDLTNVDSVGLITARNGIEVTSGTATYGILLKGSANPIIRTELTDGSVSAGQTIGRIEWKANDGSTDGSQVTGYIESIAQAAFTGQGSPSHLIFGTNGVSGPNALTERLRITHSGLVGIGSDNPQNKLDVAGDIKILDNSPRLFFYDANATGASSATGGFEVYDKDGNQNVFCGAFAPDADNLIFGVTGSERVRIDSSGRLLQGKTETKGSTGENVPTYCTEIANTSNPNVLEIANNGTTSSSYSALVLSRSDGTTVNSHTAVDSGDKIGEVCFIGADGADRFNTAAAIAAFANADFTANDCPGNLAFYTNGGSASASERARITSAGDLIVDAGGDAQDIQIKSHSANSGHGIIYMRGNASGERSSIQLNHFGHADWLISAGGTGNGEFSITNTDQGTDGIKLNTDGDLLPAADNSLDLGSTSLRWANIYSADLQLSNEGSSNDVDGTWGQYTIQEGENDLFLLNRRNGKKYKFVLEEIN